MTERGRDVVEAPVVGEGVLRPHPGDHADGFFPLGSGFLRVNLEPVHLDERGGPPGAQIHAAIADDIEHRRPLGDPHRMVILARQQGHRMADANPLGTLGDGAIEDFWGRTVRKLPQEVMFHGPEVLEADRIRQLDLGHHLVIALLLDPVVVGFWDLDFTHEPELHGLSSLRGIGGQPPGGVCPSPPSSSPCPGSAYQVPGTLQDTLAPVPCVRSPDGALERGRRRRHAPRTL
jgi:hypothetical protein